MKRLLFFLLILCLIPNEAPCEIIDRVVAIVNDEIITLREVEEYVHVEKRDRLKSVDDYVLGIRLREKLDMLIENTLINQQAKKMRIEVSDREVEQVVENIKKQNLITEEELREQLRRENISYENFLKGIRMGLVRSKVLARVITPDVNLTEKRLIDYYLSHSDEFTEEEFHLFHIFISGLRRDAKERAEEVQDAIKKGISFEELAKIYSDDPSGSYGGDIGFVRKEDLVPEIREALKNVKEGDYTDIVRSRYGFHILMLKERKKGKVLPFEEVKEEIKRRVIQEESEKRYREYVEKLKKGSYIEVKI